jgi:hypothetical protein
MEGILEKCYFCANRWGKCTCGFPDCDDERAPFVDWKGFAIMAPNVSECTRFFVDPVVYYGEPFFQYLAQTGFLCLVKLAG